MAEDINQNFGILVHDVARLMRIVYDRRMAPLGLTRSQWWVLNNVYLREGISQSELASILDIEKATLGRLLDRLEAKDWVERRQDPNDRRSKRVFLGDKVQPTMKVMRELAHVTVEDTLLSLNETEKASMLDMLRRIRDDLSQMNNQMKEAAE